MQMLADARRIALTVLSKCILSYASRGLYSCTCACIVQTRHVLSAAILTPFMSCLILLCDSEGIASLKIAGFYRVHISAHHAFSFRWLVRGCSFSTTIFGCSPAGPPYSYEVGGPNSLGFCCARLCSNLCSPFKVKFVHPLK